MKRVFLHTRTPGNRDWDNTDREFLRLPVEGEYLTVNATSPWFKVELVVHCPFEAEFAAEVYAVQVDHLEVLNEKLAG